MGTRSTNTTTWWTSFVPALTNRRQLLVAALLVQALVLVLGWFITFRLVQREFARVVERRVIDSNRELAERLSALFPEDIGTGVMRGTSEWERLQTIVESDATRVLPTGGFACLLDPDGEILCHPEIRDNNAIADYTFANKPLLEGLSAASESEPLIEAGETDEAASGLVEFFAGDFHYVATKPLMGTDLRLLVHQPVDQLVRAGNEATRWVMISAGVSAVMVLGVSGAGLGFLLRGYEGTVEKLNRQMHENLLIAQRIQRATFPQSTPLVPGYDVAGRSVSADETGGDTFDLKLLEDGRLGLMLADATGHGVGPALAITQLQSMVRLGVELGVRMPEMIRRVNGHLARDLPAGRFVTAWFGALDPESHAIRGVSAGQGPLLVYRAATGDLEEVETDLPPLGVLDEVSDANPRETPLRPGDAFIALSDGYFEARAPDGAQFGIKGVASVVREHLHEGAGALIDRLDAAVARFTANAPADDDRTAVIVRRLP